MNTPNMQSILDRPATAIEKPKPIPVGTYTAIVKGLPRFDKSSKKQTEFVEFTLGILAAGEDVSEDDLQDWAQKPDGTTRALTDATMRVTHYITENSIWRLKDFLKHLGVAKDENQSLREMIDSTPNCSVKITVKHRASDDGSSVFAEVGGTAAAD